MNALTQDILTGGIVSIAVGPEEIPFDVHMELLCAHSPYFDKALEGRFEEPGTQYLTLPDDEPAVFTRILSWMYMPRLELPIIDETSTYEVLCKMWLSAGKYQITDLQNLIIDALKRRYESVVTARGNLDPSLIKMVYEQTSESSELRQAIIAMCVWAMDYEHFSKHRAQFPSDFKDDYALKQAQRGKENFETKMPLIFGTEAFYVKTGNMESIMKQQAILNPSKIDPDKNIPPFRARKTERTRDSERAPSLSPDPPSVATPAMLATRKFKTPKGRAASGVSASPSPSSRPTLTNPAVKRSQSDVGDLADRFEGQSLEEQP